LQSTIIYSKHVLNLFFVKIIDIPKLLDIEDSVLQQANLEIKESNTIALEEEVN